MRLIDADSIKQRINETMSADYVYATRRIKKLIEEAPTIDAVQVVRCKDCKYYNGEYQYCFLYIFAKPDGYCFYGEKTEVEE